MAYVSILPASRQWLDPSPGDASPVHADRAAAQLRVDFERWSRWAIGVGAFSAAVVGLVTLGGMADAIAEVGAVDPIGVLVLQVGAAFAVGGVLVLRGLQRSGRVLVSSAASWLRMPYALGLRSRRAVGWIEARTVNFEPRILARLVTGTLALLLAVFGVSIFFRDLGRGPTGLSFAALAIGVLALASGCGQIGGVVRLVSGMSERDPVWVWLRDSLSG